MTPKRGDDAAPPPVGDEYRVTFITNEAAKGWTDLSRQEPSNTRWAYEQMRNNPGCQNKPPTNRHSRMKREWATGIHRGVELPQWQLEVTGGGRIWYLVDHEKRTCWVKEAGRAHPKETE